MNAPLPRNFLCALFLAAPAAQAETATYQRVDFQASAETGVANDQMTATLSIEASDKSPAALAALLTQKVNNALRLAAGNPSVRLTTGNQQTWPVYDEKNKLQSWRGRSEIRLESPDFKAGGELVSRLQTDLQLNGLGFSVSTRAREEAEASLTKQAIQAFKQQAERIAASWGAKSYRLVQMSISPANPPGPQPVMYMRAAKMDGAAEGVPAADYNGGASRMVVQINGTIELQ